MKSVLSLAALSAVAGSAVANDVLISRRMDLSKRQEENGNWNVCMYSISKSGIPDELITSDNNIIS